MAKMNGQGLEALAVRRTSMTDADKVRYRVYRTKDEFIAVIAESALMAVKVSGITDPQRIVRDLPSEGVAIHAERMVAGDSGQRVSFGLEKLTKETQFAMPKAEESTPKGDFVPMQIRDLDQKRGRSIRILSAKDLDTIMGAAPAPVDQAAAQPAPAVPVAAAPEPEPEADTPGGELTPEQVQALLNE